MRATGGGVGGVGGVRGVGGGGERKYVTGLPGNPVSAFVTFQIFVREILDLLGGGAAGSRWIQGEAGQTMEANGDRDFLLPCRLRQRGAAVVGEPIPWRGSADVLGLSGADGFVLRKANAEAINAGAAVEVLRI